MSAMTCLNRELVPAIEAISLLFPDRLSWMGERIQAGTGEKARLALMDHLTWLLYSQFYCYGRPVPLPSRDPGRQALATGHFIDELRRANKERIRWTRGWKIVAKSRNGFHVSYGGLSMLVASADEVRPAEITGQAEVCFSSESLSASPGFFVIQSSEPFPREPSVRLYWNTSPEAAVVLVERITELFHRSRTLYQLKVLTSFARGERADSSVLYLLREDLPRFAGSLSQIYGEVQDSMREATPAFTLRIAPGLALAESPPDGQSFGRDRCRLVAEALVGMASEGARIGEESLEVVALHFAGRGLSLDRPYLGAGSQQQYSLSIKAKIASTAASPPMSSNRDAFLQTAIRIGNYLVRSAIWSRDACNWIAELTGLRMSYGALDPMLYSGTSGIAWFLAELYRVCGDEAVRRTAVAALLHSCRTIESGRNGYGDGLYSGSAGVAYVAWRCAGLLNRPALLEHSQRIFSRILSAESCRAGDVISGGAGMILALAAVGSEGSRIEMFGRNLIASAKQTRNALSWRTVNSKGSPNLTGFSHGTAGIASALLVLYDKTGQVEFRNAAEGAIRYERGCFSEADGNWPDYRLVRNRRSPVAYTVAWCHGAPGIALSRALAVRVCGPEPGYQSDLATALETTRGAVSSSPLGTHFCLCHGVAGNADILQLVGRAEDRKLIERAATLAIDKCHPCERDSAFSQKSPGLMTGWAGVGHFYLRVADPSVPSPLWIGPELSSLKEAA